MAVATDALTLGDLAEILLRRRGPALVAAVLSAALVLAVAFLRPPTYQATASLTLDVSQRSLSARLDPASAPVADDLVTTQRETLMSQEVLATALASVDAPGPAYHNAASPVDLLRRRLRVVAVREAWVVTLALTDEDPHRAERLLTAVLTAYREVHLRRGRHQDQVRQEALNRQVEVARGQLAQAEEEVRTYRAAHGIISTHPQDNHLAQEINQLARQRAESEGRLAEAETRAAQVVDARTAGDPAEVRRRLLALPAIAQQRSVVELAPRLVAALAERDRLAQKYLARHPRMIQAEAEVASFDLQYEAVITGAADGLIAAAEQAATSHRDIIARTADAQARATAYAEALLGLARHEERRLTLEKVHHDLLERYYQQAAAGRIDDVPLAIADQAEVNPRPVGLSGSAWLVIAAVIGMVAGAATALLREAFDSRIRDRQDLVRRHGLSVLAELPWAPTPAVDNGRLALDPALAEVLRNLRAEIAPGDTAGGRIFLVTSPGGGDGRTNLALGLALVLADAGHAVLLVDGDLRMPSLDVLFAQPATPGLTQILAGEAEIAARPTAHPNLHLMPAGGTPSNPAELLAGSCLQEWLAFCRHSHPVVVIDGPPADVADTVELARYSDALLLAVRSGWTRRSDVAAALERLSSFRPRLLGAVLAPAG